MEWPERTGGVIILGNFHFSMKSAKLSKTLLAQNFGDIAVTFTEFDR